MAGEADKQTKIINDARERAHTMYALPECKRARQKKEDDLRCHKRKILDIVKQIYDNERDKLSGFYFGETYFEQRMKALNPLDRKEAEDIVQHGLGDARIQLNKAEKQIAHLQHEANEARQKLHELNAQLKAFKDQNLNERNQPTREQDASANDQIQTLKKHLIDQAAELKAMKETNDAQISENVKAQAIIAKMHQETNEMKARLAAETTPSNKAEEKIKALETKKTDPSGLQDKKRKHVKVFCTEEQQEAFRASVKGFVGALLEPSTNQQSFITSQEIKAAFLHDGQHISSERIFFMELHAQIQTAYPLAKYTHNRDSKGYHGVSLKK